MGSRPEGGVARPTTLRLKRWLQIVAMRCPRSGPCHVAWLPPCVLAWRRLALSVSGPTSWDGPLAGPDGRRAGTGVRALQAASGLGERHET
jgi:hypothetical protein